MVPFSDFKFFNYGVFSLTQLCKNPKNYVKPSKRILYQHNGVDQNQ